MNNRLAVIASVPGKQCLRIVEDCTVCHGEFREQAISKLSISTTGVEERDLAGGKIALNKLFDERPTAPFNEFRVECLDLGLVELLDLNNIHRFPYRLITPFSASRI